MHASLAQASRTARKPIERDMNSQNSFQGGVEVKVAWYDPALGFGFLNSPQFGNIFLHMEVASRLGSENIKPGATLFADIVKGPKGWFARRVLDEWEAHQPKKAAPTTSETAPPDSGGGATPVRRSVGNRGGEFLEGETAVGVVRSFDYDKGYGFLELEDGRSIFIHVRALEKSNLPMPSVGAQFSFSVMIDRHGRPQANNVRLEGVSE